MGCVLMGPSGLPCFVIYLFFLFTQFTHERLRSEAVSLDTMLFASAEDPKGCTAFSLSSLLNTNFAPALSHAALTMGLTY